jgi:hypothetical protein
MCPALLPALLALQLLGVCGGNGGGGSGSDENLSWVLNTPSPPWARAAELTSSAGVHGLLSARAVDGGQTSGAAGKKGKKNKNKAVDGESVDAMNNYFYGLANGVVLEMGAINGNWSSESLPLESIGWKRVLIEGIPEFKDSLALWKDAFVYNAAVCEEATKVHYAVNNNFFVSGIIEFMPPEYLEKWYKGIYKMASAPGKAFDLSRIEWSNVKSKRNRVEIHQIECLPMSTILEHSGLKHINFMILDIEGAEVVALKSIDFKKIRFDVIVVENNRESELRDFFKESDYRFDKQKGRNLWFVHKEYSPSTAPINK